MSGNGREKKEIEKYLHSQNIQFQKLIDPDQQHTDNIIVNPTSDVENCDGLITEKKGTVLTMITADCIPLLCIDTRKQIVGISHNGRRGTEQKLVQKMIQKFYALGSTLHDLRIAVGPAIGACCYPMNLNKENVDQLLAMGIKKDHIDFFPFCTKCDSKRFFSYRRFKKESFYSAQDVPSFPEQFSFISIS